MLAPSSSAPTPACAPAPASSLADMRAIVQPAYGSTDVLRYERVRCPAAAEGQVLVAVEAASVCKGDVHLLTGKPYLIRLGFGLRRPKQRIPGQNMAGRVVAVGPAVTGLRVGDAVYGEVAGGAFAELVAAPAAALAPKPPALSFAAAATVPVSAVTALQALRDVGRVRAGDLVLINGASGGVGTFAVQIAKALGAEVTGICSGRSAQLVRSLGADHVVDYTRQDVLALGRRYDVMLDLVGNRTQRDVGRLLAPDGVFIASAGSPNEDGGGVWVGPLCWMAKVIVGGLVRRKWTMPFLAQPRRADLLELNPWLEAGTVRPVVEQEVALEDVPVALRHVARGHSQGTTAVRVGSVD
ncbi:MAG: NAD(P)-dependent alcohol dehydrogenase [Planctomycetota bacterium]